jgi:hypothetical protein
MNQQSASSYGGIYQSEALGGFLPSSAIGANTPAYTPQPQTYAPQPYAPQSATPQTNTSQLATTPHFTPYSQVYTQMPYQQLTQVQPTHPQLQLIHAAQQIPQVQVIQAIPQVQDTSHMSNVQPLTNQTAAQLSSSQQVSPQQQILSQNQPWRPSQHQPWNSPQHQQLLKHLANVSYDDESGTIGFNEHDALGCGNTKSKDADTSHFHQMQSGCNTDSDENSSVQNMQLDLDISDGKVHSYTTFGDSDKCEQSSDLLLNCQMVVLDSTQHPIKRGTHQEVKVAAAEKSMHDAGSQSVSTDELNSGHFLGFAKHLVTVGNWTFEMDSPGNMHNELEHFRKFSCPGPSEHTKHKASRSLTSSKYNSHIKWWTSLLDYDKSVVVKLCPECDC